MYSIAPGGCFASQTPERLLRTGLTFFKREQYSDALSRFQSLCEFEGENPYRDAGLFLLAKTNVRLGDFEQAETVIRRFFAEFPRSSYRQYTKYLLAEIYFAQGYEPNAILWLLELVKDDNDPSLRELASEKLEILLKNKSKLDLHNLQEQTSPAGRKYIDNFIGRFIDVGAIYLLIADGDSVDLEIAEGMSRALEIHRGKSDETLPEFRIINVGSSSIEAALAVKSLKGEKALLVLSALEGEQSIAASAASNCLSAPMLIVSDNTPDIWKIGDKIWQLAPDKESMGTALADFAVEQLGYRRFAVMAPLDSPQRRLSEAFITKAEELGAEIAALEWYYSESSDLGKYFKRLRRQGFRIVFSDSLQQLAQRDSLFIDSVYAEILPDSLYRRIEDNLFKIDSLNAETDSLLWMEFQRQLIYQAKFQRVEIDSNNIPLECFDGFLFLFSPQKVDMYIPQFAFYNFRTNILSEANSFSPQSLAKYNGYLDNLTTVRWGYVDRGSMEFISFNTEYLTVSENTPTDNELLGLDVMNFVLALLNTPDSDTGIPDHYTYDGICRDFQFAEGRRSNMSIRFLLLEGDTFKPLQSSNGKVVK